MQSQPSGQTSGPDAEVQHQPFASIGRNSENPTNIASSSRWLHDDNDVGNDVWRAQYLQDEPSRRSSNISSADTESSYRPQFDHMENIEAGARNGSQCESSPNPGFAGTKGVASRVLGRLKSLPSRATSNDASEDKATQSDIHENTTEPENIHQTSVEHNSVKKSDATESNTNEYTREALQLVRSFTTGNVNSGINCQQDSPTPEEAPDDRYYYDYDYVPAPQEYKPSVFGAILASRLKAVDSDHRRARDLNNAFDFRNSRISLLGKHSPKHKRARSVDPPLASGATTPNKKVKWYDKPDHSVISNMLVQSGLSSSGPGLPGSTSALNRPRRPRARSLEGDAPAADLEKGLNVSHSKVNSFGSSNETLVDEVADIIARRKYLTKLCAAFMKYGAPTHRMEEYLAASARALAIDAEFLYIPGAMLCTFIDHSIYANNVEVVRKNAGLDLGRLKDAFNVYKNIIHQKYGAQEGITELDEIEKRPDEHGDLFGILMFGLASVIVGPFSFNTRPIDFGPIFVLGCALGFMQLKVVPRSHQFSNVFEVFSCVLIAFISRALGSIKWGDGSYVFCFSGVSQSSIAMILPGFLVLNSALELQGKNMVSGSVRMVYAIIYVLFLGFGLLIGTTVFGLVKRDAVTDVTCAVPEWFEPGLSYKLIYTRFIWAPLFAACVALIYKAKWSQLGVMALIATAGHQANFWISTQLSSNLQVANAIGAFAIGCIANLYSRLFHGLAAAAMLPAIYCQVPGGLAASGSLVAGVDSSNQIFGNNSAISVINNGTSGFVAAQNDPSSVYGGTIYNVGYGMVQVAIGISVGLYLSALVIYPFGKRRSGLFSF